MENNPLILIVNSDIDILYKSMKSLKVGTFSIGRVISEFLIVLDEVDRSQAIKKHLFNILREKTPGPILCFDIDLLFHPLLHLDPLGLFQQISRSTSLIVLWPGSYKDGVLSYAQPEHEHYRFWKNLDGVEIKGVSNAIQ